MGTLVIFAKVALSAILAALAGAGLVLAVKVSIDGQFLIGVGAIIASCAAAYGSVRNSHDIAAVHKEVKTVNAQTMAQLADATETRRIDTKVEAGEPLTKTEAGHVASVDETGKER